jgi:hypothetical protein
MTNKLLGPVAEPDLLERLGASRGRRLRRVAFRALAASDHSERGRGATLRGAAGSAWRRTRPRTQVRLARLVGLAEYATPSPRQLRLRYRAASRAALLPLAVLHPLAVLGRSALAFAILSLGRRQRSQLHLPVRF